MNSRLSPRPQRPLALLWPTSEKDLLAFHGPLALRLGGPRNGSGSKLRLARSARGGEMSRGTEVPRKGFHSGDQVIQVEA